MKTQLLLFFSICFFNAFAQDGTLDTSFNNSNLGANDFIRDMAIQPDGKIIIVGDFTSYNGFTANRIARILPNGDLDIEFAIGPETDLIINTVALQPDGKIVVAGDFTTLMGVSKNRIGRLNPDGTIDASFVSTGANQQVLETELQGDKMLLAGNFITFNGIASNCIDRMNILDGSTDFSFNPGSGTDGVGNISTISVQSDNKIIIGGTFNSYQGNPCNGIARINNDGSFDTTFNVGIGVTGFNDYVYATAIQTNGKILIGGTFEGYNGTNSSSIARLNTDGSLDTTFAATGSGFNNTVTAIKIQPDGKILVSGWFTAYNGVPVNRLIRLNSDGTIDSTFTVGTGLDNFARSFAIQNDNKILIGGVFTEYNGTSVGRLARLNTPTLTNNEVEVVETTIVFPNPSNGIFNISSEVAFTTIRVFNSLGQNILETNYSQIDLSQYPRGMYLLELSSDSKKSTHKIILN